MPNSHSENTKRIAKTTMMLYCRMLFTMGVSLYTTRIVLVALGEDDYGLYNLVGAIIGMMGMLTTLLSQGTSRFITIALGRNNVFELKSTFSASFTIHVIFASVIFFIGEIIGLPVIDSLNIDPNRLEAAHYVFQISLITAVVGIVQSPFNAAIIAHEKMTIYAYISIFESVAKLFIVYLLISINADKLKLYATFYLIVSLISILFYYIYSKRQFEECKSIRFRTDSKLYTEIFKYTGWNAIGTLAFTMNGQGITILLNMFGVAVIAARGISNTVSTFVFNFIYNFQVASRPQIIKFYSNNDINGMNNLIVRTSKFSAYLLGLIGIPLFIETDYVLNLWLKEVPEYTADFVRLSLVQGFIQSIDFPIGAGIHAIGKMKLPNLTSSLIYMIILPISYGAIKMGASPTITYIMIVSVYPLALFMDLYILKKYAGFRIVSFLKKDIARAFSFVLLSFFITQYIISHIELSFIRLVFTISISSIIFISSIYFWGLTDGERSFIKEFVLKKNKI